MNSIDKKLVRTRLGSFILDKKKYEVFKPTLRQIFTHTIEQKEAFDKMKELAENEDNLGYVKTRMEWLIRELQIFIPEMGDDAQDIDDDQRDEILKIIFPPVEESEEVKSVGKKKEPRGGK